MIKIGVHLQKLSPK